MKFLKRSFIILFVAVLVSSAVSVGAATTVLTSPAEVENALSGLEGNQALSWDDFWVGSTYVAGQGGTISCAKVTDSMGLFAEYLSYDLTAFGAKAGSTDTQISLRDTSGNYGFKGNIAAGDVYLLHMIIRSTPDDATKPMKFHMSIYGEGSSFQYPATSGHPDDFFVNGKTDDLPTVWTEYYIPVQAHKTYAPDKIILFLNPGGGTGTVDLACMEIVNYGKSVTLDQLPAATIDLTDYTLSGRTVMYWESFYNRCTKSITSPVNATLTKVSDADGMFSRYVRLDVTALGSSYKHAQINYLDYGSPTTTPKGWELFRNAKAGDTVLIHLIARSDAADGEGSFRIAYYQQGKGSSDTPGTAAALDMMTVGNLWTEFYIPVKTGSVDPNRASIFGAYEKQTLDVAMFEIIDYKDADVSSLPSSKRVIEVGAGAEFDFYGKFNGEEIAVDIDGLTSAKALSGINTVDISDGADGNFYSGDMLLFSFVLMARDECTPVTITAGGKTMTYYVPVQWTRYYMPVATKSLTSVTIDGNVLLAEAKFVNHKSTSINAMALTSGPWLLEEFDDVVLDENGVKTGGTKDLVKSGNFVYSIGGGNFVVTDVTDVNNPVIRSSIESLGSAIRQIAICKSGVDVMVTSRSNGAYIINISDPDNPYVRSQYDSIEMATGLCVYQDYAFICNRQYGVEIIDISDLDNPVHVTNILTTGTVQSCEVLDGILYCGQWAQCCVSMYDITNVDAPAYINDVLLNGKGDGIFIDKVDGKTYLYAATGQHNLKASDSDKQSNLNFGQGNGLDIIDITDPTAPHWLSTTNIDGRFYYASNDFWEVKVSQSLDGKRYAYCMNTHNGVIVLDVTDPAAPIRLARYTIAIPKGSSNYSVLSYATRETIVPYDYTQLLQDAIASIYVEEGTIYLAGNITGLHIVQNDEYLFEASEPEITVPIVNGEGSYYDFDSTGYEDFKSYVNGTQFYAVATYDGKLYAAAGSAGVLVFDAETMEYLSTVQTMGAAMDVVFYENKLYVAERTAGLGGYIIGTDGSATEFLRYSGGQNAIRGVRLSPRGRFAVVMYSSNNAYVVDIQDPNNPTRVLNCSAASHLYHRNLSGPISDRYVVAWAGSGNEFWIDFGEGDTLETPVQMRKITASAAEMRGSIVDLGDGTVLATRGNGYVIYDPENTSVDPRTTTLYKISGITMTGKAYLYNENVLILSNRIDRTIQLIDITDRTAPKLLKQISVSGNPDIATVYGDYLYVPMGYQGLFRFKLSQFMNAQTVSDGQTAGYLSLQEAVDAAQSGYVKLMKDVTEDVVIPSDVYLDLNGKTLTGSVTGEGTLYGMDSSTDGYSVDNLGRITGSVSCNVAANFKTDVTGSVRHYMALTDEQGVTFHRFYLSVTHMNLKPGVTGVGYKAVFAGDDMVKAQIDSYGFNLWVGEGEKYTASKIGETFTSLKTVTLRLQNFDVENYGEASVNSTVFIKLKDGTTIESGEYSYTLRNLMETIDSNVSSFTQEQLSALKAMCKKHSGAMKDWNIGNILN